jgi:hypothetical protein
MGRVEHDPGGKFSNAFTERLFGAALTNVAR